MSSEQFLELVSQLRQDCFGSYVSMLQAVLPCVFVIGVFNLVVSLFLNAFFKGKLKIGGDI